MYEIDRHIDAMAVFYESSYEQYKEEIRLSQVEIEVIDWITTGKIPKMTDPE